LGTKNRIFLGIITSAILHNIRNRFNSKNLFLNKKKAKILKQTRIDESKYIYENNFQIILDNTLATCQYKENGLINFISKVENRYILYSISTNNYYNEVATIFFTSKRQLRKCQLTIDFFSDKFKDDFLNDLKS